MSPEVPSFSDLLAECDESAVHLEMRDGYTPSDPVFLDWKAGVRIEGSKRYPEWFGLVRATVARGVQIRRVRIVSEPLADFIRFEYDVTEGLNVAAGEQVRWLSRRRASDLALPGNDFWVFDGRIVRFGYFAGDGEFVGHDVWEDPDVVKLCTSAFEAAWERGVDHDDYRPA
ncbi:hypothetical protein GCM10029978_033620 [Actinoallomurus acanthiterrae]